MQGEGSSFDNIQRGRFDDRLLDLPTWRLIRGLHLFRGRSGQTREDDQRSQRNEDPRPGAQCVVGDRKEEACTLRLTFISTSSQTLYDISISFGVSPPAGNKKYNEKDRRQRGVVEWGKKGDDVFYAPAMVCGGCGLGAQQALSGRVCGGQSADPTQLYDRYPGKGDGSTHTDKLLTCIVIYRGLYYLTSICCDCRSYSIPSRSN